MLPGSQQRQVKAIQMPPHHTPQAPDPRSPTLSKDAARVTVHCTIVSTPQCLLSSTPTHLLPRLKLLSPLVVGSVPARSRPPWHCRKATILPAGTAAQLKDHSKTTQRPNLKPRCAPNRLLPRLHLLRPLVVRSVPAARLHARGIHHAVLQPPEELRVVQQRVPPAAHDGVVALKVGLVVRAVLLAANEHAGVLRGQMEGETAAEKPARMS